MLARMTAKNLMNAKMFAKNLTNAKMFVKNLTIAKMFAKSLTNARTIVKNRMNAKKTKIYAKETIALVPREKSKRTARIHHPNVFACNLNRKRRSATAATNMK